MLHKDQLKRVLFPLFIFIFSALLATVSPPATPVPTRPEQSRRGEAEGFILSEVEGFIPSEVEGPPSAPPKGEKLIDGFEYTQKLHVYTTSYDGNCLGCRGRTYSGTEVKKGVCAVDPEVIPLGTWFYIPTYGKCHAEDIGGAVKGYRVDVGWEDAKKGWLPQGWKDIYILK